MEHTSDEPLVVDLTPPGHPAAADKTAGVASTDSIALTMIQVWLALVNWLIYASLQVDSQAVRGEYAIVFCFALTAAAIAAYSVISAGTDKSGIKHVKVRLLFLLAQMALMVVMTLHMQG